MSRIPVLNAYAQLLAEGYFESRKGAGTFVSDSLPEVSPFVRIERRNLPSGFRTAAGCAARLALSAERPPWAGGWGAFSVHQPAFDRFPFQIWSSIIMRHCRSPRLSAIHNIDPLALNFSRGYLYLPSNRASGSTASRTRSWWFPARNSTRDFGTCVAGKREAPLVRRTRLPAGEKRI